jgi:NAD(P)-dependent dehydrogenase (short-subunit alcohol dehydrogenase family)
MAGLPHSPHAVVTGAARGIGREIAATLARAGAVVTALGRQSAGLEDLVAKGDAHFSIVADVTDRAAVDAAIREAAARRPIDILIANAGAAESAPFAKSDAALFARIGFPSELVAQTVEEYFAAAMRLIDDTRWRSQCADVARNCDFEATFYDGAPHVFCDAMAALVPGMN